MGRVRRWQTEEGKHSAKQKDVSLSKHGDKPFSTCIYFILVRFFKFFLGNWHSHNPAPTKHLEFYSMVPVPGTNSRNIKKWLKFIESSWPQINGILFGCFTSIYIAPPKKALARDLVVKPFTWIDTNLKNDKSRQLLTTSTL